MAKAKIDIKSCIGCGSCSSICPVGAIKMIKGKAQVDTKKCIGCGSCSSICPMSAISLEK